MKSQRGFSLLTIVVVLVGLLLFVTGLIILLNPLERAREQRDKKRYDDIVLLDKAIRFYLRDNTDNPKLCDGCVAGQVIFANRTITIGTFASIVVNSTGVTGGGWVPVDFSLNADFGKTPLLSLPLDPVNKDPFVYTFTPGKNGNFKLTTTFESKSFQAKMASDGGTLIDRFEDGTDLSLPPN